MYAFQKQGICFLAIGIYLIRGGNGNSYKIGHSL